MKKSSLKYPRISFERRMRRIAWLMTSLLCLLACLAGCKTQYVAMPEIHTLYHHATDLRVDSTSRDRWHEVFTRGDTVFIHDSIDRWHYRLINTTDTVHQTDSVPYPVEVPKYIRQRNLYDRITAAGFWIGIGIMLIGILLFFIGRYYNRRWPTIRLF